jgi:hypothetical protein
MLQNSLGRLRRTLRKLCFDFFHLVNGVHTVHPLQNTTNNSQRVQTWADSGMGKDSLTNFCDCLMCAQVCAMLGIVEKEKTVFSCFG